MSHTISNSLDLIMEGYSSGCEIEENEIDQYIVWDKIWDEFNCDFQSEASNDSDDSDDPSEMLTVTKKEKMLNKLEGAREAKRRKTEAQQNFAELFDEGEVLTNKSDIFTRAMQKLDSGFPWTKNRVANCVSCHIRTLNAHYTVWKSLQHERDDVKLAKFKYHVDNLKPGRQMAAPLDILGMKKKADDLIEEGQGHKCSTFNNLFNFAAVPTFCQSRLDKDLNVAAGEAMFERSRSAKWRLSKKIAPCKRKGVKKLIQSRVKARKNPCGAFSLVAAMPLLLEGVHPHNIICIDSTTSFINESVPEKVWMTEEKKGSMKRRRAGAKAETNNGQRRSFKMNIAMRKGPNPLASLAGIVSDHCFTTLTRFPVTETYDIIFAPHCPEDEAENDDPDDEVNKDPKSLKYRQATMIYEECIIPKVLKQTQDMIRFAKDVLKLPNAEELYRIVRVFQDGESGPIDNIMDKLAANYSLIERPGAAPEQVAAGAVSEQAAVDADITGASEQTQAASAFAPNAAIAAFERVFTDTPFAAAMLRYAKLPPGQTNDCQVNDMATLHPLLHAGFASLEFYSLTEAGMQKIVEEHPGLVAPLKFLDESSMSGKSKETYKKAIVYLVKLIQRALTPAIVDDAMKTAGYYPLDPARIMFNMWDHFEYLSPTEADEAIRIAEGPCRDIFRRDGMILPDATVAAVEASEILGPIVVFPEIPANFDKRVINRQSTTDLSHKEVHAWRARRVAEAQAAEEAKASRKATAAELERKLGQRMSQCKDGEGIVDANGFTHFKCKCKDSRTFCSAKEFKAHENLKQHKAEFGKVDENGDYAK